MELARRPRVAFSASQLPMDVMAVVACYDLVGRADRRRVIIVMRLLFLECAPIG